MVKEIADLRMKRISQIRFYRSGHYKYGVLKKLCSVTTIILKESAKSVSSFLRKQRFILSSIRGYDIPESMPDFPV